MAKLVRKLLNLFGSSGSSSSFGQFGSQTAGAPVNTKDILSIQGLQAWLDGWQSAVYGTNKAPFLEDLNALHYVLCYEAAYTLQEGVPEYDSTTTYFIGSIVKKTGTSEFYESIVDNNVGNALPSKASNASWQYVINKGILQYDSSYSYSIGEITQKPGTAELYMSLTNNNVGNALPSQVTSAIWQYLTDLANITPPVAGVSQIKFGFLPVTLTTSVTATTSLSKIPTVDFGFDPAMSVYAFIMVRRNDFNINSGGAGAFSFTSIQEATLSGSGVDASGAFLMGGAPANSYTLSLTTTISTNIGTGANTFKAVAVFVGIK